MAVALQPYVTRNAAHDLWPWHISATSPIRTPAVQQHSPPAAVCCLPHWTHTQFKLHATGEGLTQSQLLWVAYPHAPAALLLGGPHSPSGRFEEDVCRESKPDLPHVSQFGMERALLAPYVHSNYPATNKQSNSSTNTLPHNFMTVNCELLSPTGQRPVSRSADRRCEANTRLPGLRKVESNSRQEKST
jgi:hypothetical protein